MVDFEVRSEKRDGWTVIAVRGDVDVATAPYLAEALEAARQRQVRVIVDLGQVSFMDSTGIKALLEGQRRCQTAGGEMVVARPTEPVRRVLGMTGLTDHFRFTGPPDEVLEQGRPLDLGVDEAGENDHGIAMV